MVYTGSTGPRGALLAGGSGAQVKVSYDTQSTRPHAKAWHFRKKTGYSTATSARRTCRNRHCLVTAAWSGTCGCRKSVRRTCWRSPTRPSRATGPAPYARIGEGHARAGGAVRTRHRVRPRRCVRRAARLPRRGAVAPPASILEKLDVERKRHHRWRNLVVAATGTGKTIVRGTRLQALVRGEDGLGSDPRLLFVAHRQEILRQSLGVGRCSAMASSASSMSPAMFRRGGCTSSGPSSPSLRWLATTPRQTRSTWSSSTSFTVPAPPPTSGCSGT